MKEVKKVSDKEKANGLMTTLKVLGSEVVTVNNVQVFRNVISNNEYPFKTVVLEGNNILVTRVK